MYRFVCLEQVSSKGTKIENEDRIFCSRNLAIVLDGATGLSDKSIPASWIVDNIISFFIEEYNRFRNSEQYRVGVNGSFIESILRKTIRKIIEKYNEEFGEVPEDRSISPSAAGAIVATSDSAIEYAVFGDVSIVVRYTDGRITRIYDQRLEEMDNRVIEKLRRIMLYENKSYKEAMNEIRNDLIENRRKLCRSDGYSSLSLYNECVGLGLYGRLDPSDVDFILIASDGFMSIVDTYKQFNIYELMQSLSYDKIMLSDLVGLIRRIESKDKDVKTYPRFSISDDASAIKIRIIE